MALAPTGVLLYFTDIMIRNRPRGPGRSLQALAACLFLAGSGASGCGDPKKEVPGLVRELGSSESKTRSQAALRLGRIGSPHAVPAVGPLIALLGDENPGVRSAAAYALRQIDTPEARAALDANRQRFGVR